VVRAVMAELHWSGVAHVDLRAHEESGEISIIEINPRFWGSVLGSLHAGVNFPYLACLNALGQEFDYPQFRDCRYVAGTTAAGIWRSGKYGITASGFALGDTVFRYILDDPLSSVLEWFLK
jgi:D-aspartate ligase